MFKNKVGRPSNETIKKRRIFNIVLIVIIFIVLFSLTYTLTNISTKRLKGDSGPTYYGVSCDEDSACYEAGFRNGNLYQRVIDSYNSGNGGSLSYNDVITDDELSAIRYLDAGNGNIDDTTGIEKLVNLEELYLSNNNITSIDLSNNTNIELLYLDKNSLNEINLNNLTNLTLLNVNENNLFSLNISHNLELEHLQINENNIGMMNFSENIKLNVLAIDYDTFSLSDINIDQLTTLVIDGYILLKNESLDLSTLGITMDSSVEIEDEDVISIENNIVIAEDIGISTLISNSADKEITIVFIISDSIESSKYNIDYENRYIYTGLDEDEEIINNLYYEHEFLDMLEIDEYDFDINNNLLNISIPDTDLNSNIDTKVRPYKLGRIDLSNYEVNGKVITVDSSFNYEDVPYYNVTLEYSDNELIVKDLNGNEVDRYTVNVSGNTLPEPEEIDQGNENGTQAPEDNSSTTKSSNIEESTTTKVVEEKTSKKTTLNKFENNAKTYDDIVKYFIIGGIAVVLIIGVIIYTKKKQP